MSMKHLFIGNLFRFLLAVLFLAVISALPVFAQAVSLGEYSGYVESKKGLYLKFSIPENAVGASSGAWISINCSTSMEYTSKMIFGVCSTEEDARNFYSQGRYHCHPGSYEEYVQEYHKELDGFIPGKTYYFVAYNDSYGILSASEYEIEVSIGAYVESGFLGVTCDDIGSYYDYNYRELVRDKLFENGPDGYRPIISGVAVAYVYPGSPAELCGIKIDDIIVSIDGVSVSAAIQLMDVMLKTVPKQTITVGIRRFQDGNWTYQTVRCRLIDQY